MMNGWGGIGIGSGLVHLLMVLFWLGLLAVIVLAVVKLLPGSGSGSGSGATPTRAELPPGAPAESPEQILDRMFATGEIDEATYRARRQAIADMKGRS